MRKFLKIFLRSLGTYLGYQGGLSQPLVIVGFNRLVILITYGMEYFTMEAVSLVWNLALNLTSGTMWCVLRSIKKVRVLSKFKGTAGVSAPKHVGPAKHTTWGVALSPLQAWTPRAILVPLPTMRLPNMTVKGFKSRCGRRTASPTLAH